MSSPSKISSTDEVGSRMLMPGETSNSNTGPSTESSRDNRDITAVEVVTSLVPVPVLSIDNTPNTNQNEFKPPGNLQELLKLSSSLQSTPRDNAVVQTPMDDEKQKFLIEVLNQMTVNVEDNMKKVIEFLSTVNNDAQRYEEYENLLEEIVERVCSLDMANLFYQLGGLDALVPFLRHNHPGYRWRALNIVAECCKNNPYCSQSTACSIVFNLLMDLASEEVDMNVKFQALSAISAVVRDNMTGVARFQLGNGFAILKDALDNGNEKIASKCAFLIMSLSDTDQQAQNELVRLGTIETLITLARMTNNLMAEYFLRALISLTNRHEGAIKECSRPEYDFNEFLKKTVITKHSDEACKELVECALELQERLSNRETT